MPATDTTIDIPKRALFKSAEVCEIVKVQPYVLRSWEAEFPGLGISKGADGPRTYRRADVEQVLRIKHLLLVEGLTLAGARRRLEEEETPIAADEPALEELIGQNARERLTAVKRGLRSILDLLSGQGTKEFRLAPPPQRPQGRVRPVAPGRAKAPRGKAAAPRGATRRKRSA